MKNYEGKKCPNCSKEELIHVIYGMPSLEGIKLSQQGKVYLKGSCLIVDIIKSNWHCKNCDTEGIDYDLSENERS